MKNLPVQILLFLGILIYVPALSSAQDFEGVIYYEINDMKEQGMEEMPYMIKGPKARMEFGSGQEKGAMILMPEESQMVILIETMKGYMKMDTRDAEGEMDDYSDTDATKTGETKTIAGRECEVWNIKSEENTIEACMAKGMGTFMMPKSPMAKDNTPEWVKELMDEGAMPLEVIEIKNGNRSVQMRATRIEEKSLSDDLFTIPEGYRDMSDMMKQMQQMNQN